MTQKVKSPQGVSTLKIALIVMWNSILDMSDVRDFVETHTPTELVIVDAGFGASDGGRFKANAEAKIRTWCGDRLQKVTIIRGLSPSIGGIGRGESKVFLAETNAGQKMMKDLVAGMGCTKTVYSTKEETFTDTF